MHSSRARWISLVATLAYVALLLPVGPAGARVAGGPTAPAAVDPAGGAYACRQDTHPWAAGAKAPGHVHVAGLVEAPNGDLLMHMDGDPLRGPDNHGRGWGITRAFVTRMKPGQGTWPHPVEIPYDNPDAAHNTVLWNDGKGRIHDFFTTRQGPSHSASTLDYRYSDDSGYTWSTPEVLRAEHGWMFGTRPFRMSNGELFVPVYKEAAPWGTGALISDDDFATYEVHPAADLPWPGVVVGGLQGAVVELEPGHLLNYMRTQARYIYASHSYDYGRTWTPAVPTQFPNPWSRVDLLKTDSGNLILAYNPSGSSRSPLTLALSEDGGLTWPYSVNVEDNPEFRYSYPFLLQSSDGWLHMGYSHMEGRTIRHLVFNEDYIRTGGDMTSNPEFVKTEYRDGALADVAVCAHRHGNDGVIAPPAPYACRQDIHPQDEDYPGVHVATLEQAPNGDLLYGFYAGQREKATDVRTYMARLRTGRQRWVEPRVVFDEPDKPDGNAVFWTDDRNKAVHLLFSTIMDDGWTEANLRVITSHNNGLTWSQPRFVREEWGWLFGTQPFRMTNGEVIVPIYSEEEWSSGFYISDDDLATVTAYPSDDATTWPRSLGGMIQPATVELEPGHLLAMNRSRDGLIWKTESTDYGKTWTDAVPTNLPNNNSRIALLKLDNGHLVLAHNPSVSGRDTLRLSISADGGLTWPHSVDVESESGQEFSYPYLLATDDGMIHLGYTHRRKSMRHLVFNESFVISGPNIPSNPAYDVKAEYAGGALRDVAVCAYAPATTS